MNAVCKNLKSLYFKGFAALFVIYYFCSIEQKAGRHMGITLTTIWWRWWCRWRDVDEGEQLVNVFDVGRGLIWEVKQKFNTDNVLSLLGLEPMPYTSVALMAQYLNVHMRKLDIIPFRLSITYSMMCGHKFTAQEGLLHGQLKLLLINLAQR